MSEQKKKLKKRQKKRLKRIFLRTVGTTLAILGIVSAGLAFVYHNYLYDNSGGTIFVPKENDPINKTLAVFGVDEDGYRTDVLFIVNYNSKSGKMRMISIPRDTMVEWTSSQQDLSELRKGYRVSTTKINEMTSYGGMENVRNLTIAQIEDMLDIQIDNYVVITLDAFRQIVDAIGGVEVDVPALEDGNGLQYDDNYQDLHIHLSPGVQLLDGQAAEGLVRFRKGYAEGDVGRIKTQQLFLEAFAKKVTSPAIITKAPSIINTILNTVTTDVKLTEMSGYLPYLKSMKAENLSFNIVPGEPKYIDSKSYYVVNEEQIPEFMKEVFSDKPTEGEEGEAIVVDKSVSIQILNSTGIGGLAGKAKDNLEAEGYQVSEIGNYDEVLGYTIIYAKDEKLGKQFLNYYPNAKVVSNTEMNYDICIALGEDVS